MRAFAQALMPHLTIVPILLPLLTACLLLLLDGRPDEREGRRGHGDRWRGGAEVR